MKSYIKIKTDEVGKQQVLTGATPENITLCNIEAANTESNTFFYDQGNGELYLFSKGVFEISGKLHLISSDDESVDLTIHLVVNGTPVHVLYSGIGNERILQAYQKGLQADDVLEFTVTAPDDVTIETLEGEQFITVKRLY